VLDNIGGIEAKQDRYGDALRSYQQALVIYQQLGDRSAAAKVTRSIERIQALINGAAGTSPAPSPSPRPSTSPP
jgi:hypothetical protein